MLEVILTLSWIFIGVLVILIVSILKNPERGEQLVALLSRIFASQSLKFDKAYIAMDIQSKLNSFTKNINSEAVDVLPYPAKIEWVTSAEKQTLIRNNEIVIRLDNHAEQSKNFVYATTAYVSKGLFPYSRAYIDEQILKSCDLVVTSKILRKEEKALRIFFDEILNPIIEEQPEIKEITSLMMELDNSGFFSRILLRELWDLGRRLYPKESSLSIREETKDLLKTLENLAKKERGVDINPTLEKDNIKMSIVLVARYVVVSARGIEPYVNWINECITKGIYTIHILAAGFTNVQIAKLVARHFEKSMKIEKIEETKIPKNKMPEGIHILFKERMA